MTDLRALLSGATSLADVDPGANPGFDGDKKAGEAALAALGPELADLQERLFAAGTRQSSSKVLLLLQGMDTSGKGGTIEKVAGLVNPQGLRITSFKKPTEQERAHDFLWRVEKALPGGGQIGIFDRSQYEDVLIQRVRQFAPAEEIERRYGAINDFERAFVEGGGRIVKCILHISKDDQKQRLVERLADPTKHWKYNPGDLDERALWDDYQAAYDVVLQRTSTDVAPWYVVPSSRKWYRNWAVATLLLAALRDLDLEWPVADFDVEVEQERVAQA